MRDDGRMYAQREDDAASSAGASAAENESATETTAAPTHQHRRVTSFRSRRSSLSTKQQSTWDRRWPELGKVARSDDGGAIVHVIDHGVGIPPQYRDLVWERFARAPIESHRLVPGTGLGLPIVKALLESRLGGSARLLDTPGGGTTVEVVLPAVAPAVSSPHTVV